MLMTIIGLAVPTLVSIEGALSGSKRLAAKALLIACAFGGFGLGVYSASEERGKTTLARQQAQSVSDRLDAANRRLEAQGEILSLVNSTVGDLGTLNRLSGGNKYYVRIAADTSRERLEPYLAAIERQFRGARSSGLVGIREPRPGSRNFELTFGSGLDVAAAEAFQRLATLHGFHPGQVIPILPEP